jgi:hypothetical protein
MPADALPIPWDQHPPTPPQERTQTVITPGPSRTTTVKPRE